MAKKYDKQTLAKDYLDQMEWENNHPVDGRGRPSWKHEPKWKYKRVYPSAYRTPTWITVILVVVGISCMGLAIFFNSTDLKLGFASLIVLLIPVILILFIAPKSK